MGASWRQETHRPPAPTSKTSGATGPVWESAKVTYDEIRLVAMAFNLILAMASNLQARKMPFRLKHAQTWRKIP